MATDTQQRLIGQQWLSAQGHLLFNGKHFQQNFTLTNGQRVLIYSNQFIQMPFVLKAVAELKHALKSSALSGCVGYLLAVFITLIWLRRHGDVYTQNKSIQGDALANIAQVKWLIEQQKIVLVNYRLVPENPMPTPINDAFDVVKYIAKHPDEFQLDSEKLTIGGLSAGAHCAAVISYLSLKDKQIHINHQILLNGAYDPLMHKRDYAEYEAKDFMVSREGVNHIYKLWGIPQEQLRLPMYSP